MKPRRVCMIKILNKPLLKEWTTGQISSSRSSANSSILLFTCRRTIIAAPHGIIRHHPQYASLSFAQSVQRQYSTIPDQACVKTTLNVPPPSKSTSKKVKVDLHPAPKKPNNNGKLAPAPSVTLQSKSTSPSTSIPTQANVKSSVQPSDLTYRSALPSVENFVPTPPPEGTSRIGRLWHQFVQLFKFYRSGLKMILVTHRRLAADIRRRGAESHAKGGKHELSRWETRFLRTHNRDLVKLVPFVLTLLILEEALPLVVIYAPALLPSTCLLPNQRESIVAKRRAKQIVHLEDARAELARLNQHDSMSLTGKGVRSLNLNLARAVSGLFLRPTWGPLFLQQRRIEKRLAYLSGDDALLAKEGFGARLTDGEVIEALEERGLIPASATPQHLRGQLRWWIEGTHDDKTRLSFVLHAATRDIQVKD